MSNKIAVVGAGQLGSRHLQGLAQMGRPLEIFIVDPVGASLRVALERFQAMNPPDNISVVATEDMATLPKTIDAAIVATTANIRLRVIEQLLGHAEVGCLLLEKVLFQDLAQYAAAEQLLGALSSKTWVNCAQRLWPFFKELRQHYQGDPNLELIVSGSQWGLGCNAVHNTDIADFLWPGAVQRHTANLDQGIIESKRSGFKEFTGELLTRVDGGGLLRQVSFAAGSAPFTFDVFHPEIRMSWNVVLGKLHVANEQSNWEWVAQEMQAPYQSQLTASVMANMLDGVDCGLPTYENAARTHVATLMALLDGAREKGADFGSVCPIT